MRLRALARLLPLVLLASACSEGEGNTLKGALSAGQMLGDSDGTSATTGSSEDSQGGSSGDAGGGGSSGSSGGDATSDGLTTSGGGGGEAECGNGIVEAGELCDDGNLANTDECTAACEPAACGDGHVHIGVEACDDGNLQDGDACTASCQLPGCGDGNVDPGEECDDGNQSNDDACTNLCTKPGCGDGIVQPGEECDDGNQSDNDACLSSCAAAKCGDGVIQQGAELCDDANLDNTDACLTTCEPAKCGDGFIHKGVEPCDSSPVPNGSCNACSVACNAGYGDCNKNAADGCEVDTKSNKSHCGGCGIACGGAQSCVAGSCVETYGPEHNFAGMTSNHFVTQGCCSVGCAGNDATDAAYFCAHFYGNNCTPKPGYYKAITPFPAYPKMHKYGGCSPYGAIIQGTQCDSGPCRITDLVENTQGLTNLICECK